MTHDDHSQLNTAVMRSKKKEQYGVECLPQLMAVCAHENKFIECMHSQKKFISWEMQRGTVYPLYNAYSDFENVLMNCASICT